jgi:hypothetical protein
VYDDPPAEVQNEIQQFRRKPLLIGAAVLAFVGYGLWYMTGGSATGSAGQAEAAIRANPFPGNPTHPDVVSVRCTQNGQSLFDRLQGLIHPLKSAGQHGSTGVSTSYTCSGTIGTGQPAYWCVTFAPRASTYSGPPKVVARQPNQACP